MPDYERTVEVAAPADAAFEYLADPANLPRYIATMTAAEPRGGETVHVAADVDGRHEEGDARLHRDPEQRRMEWSGQGEHGYTGWLRVSPTDGGSAVTVHIHSSHGDNDTEINRAFDETMNGIKRLVEAAN